MGKIQCQSQFTQNRKKSTAKFPASFDSFWLNSFCCLVGCLFRTTGQAYAQKASEIHLMQQEGRLII